MKKRLSLILPTYDEAENIKPLIDAAAEALGDIHEIIVIDDNSPDGTGDVVENMIKTGMYPSLRLEKRYKDYGLRKSIWRGIELATGDAVGWMDCDFSMPPKYLPLLLSFVNMDCDVAVGSRFVLGGTWREVKAGVPDNSLGGLLSRMLNSFVRVCLDRRFRDYTSGFVVARREVFKKIKLKGDYGEYFIDFIYRALKLNYRVAEIPYIWVSRRAGYSKTSVKLSGYYKRGRKYIVITLKLLVKKMFRRSPEAFIDKEIEKS